MTPLSVNPKVIIFVENGVIKGTATNVALDLEVIIVDKLEFFNEKSLGQPFIQSVNQ